MTNAAISQTTVVRPTSDEVAALRLQLIDNTWNPVPSSPLDKKCYVENWPQIEANEFYIDNWARNYPAHTNTAVVANRDYFGVDIDVLSDPDLAQQIHSLAFRLLGVTPFIRIGRAPRRLLVYRQRPASIRSESFRAASGNGDGIEILSAGKQFIVYGMHASTGRPYQWIGEANPLDDLPTDAPLVTQEQVDAFLDAAHAIMPFARRAGDTGTGRPRATDAARTVNAQGKITDGRESFLRDCVLRAANEINNANDPLSADAVAARGWELFEEGAVTGNWQYKDALAKARLLIRRVNSGRIQLGAHRPVSPTYAGNTVTTTAEARQRLTEVLVSFAGTPEHGTQAVRVTTGIGKTRIAAQVISETRKPGENWFYYVPTHRLGNDVAAMFIERGLSARVFQGRERPDPNNPQKTMCLNLDQVRLAIRCGESVSETCCKHKKRTCAYFSRCAYQRQTQGAVPDVWIVAHEMLFHEQKALGDAHRVVIDESFWQAGIRLAKWEVFVEDIASSLIPPSKRKEEDAADLDALRNKLAKALRQQAAVGGLQRQVIVDVLTVEDCTQAIKLEWKLMRHPEIFPGMPRERLRDVETKIDAIQRSRHLISIWGAVRELLQRPEVAISGKCLIGEKGNRRFARTRGIAPIREQWQVPTLIMDATLPDLAILRAFYPEVKIVADLEATAPHVFVQQVLKAPVSAVRLIKTASNINRNAVRRYILKRWVETEWQPTLVITQEKVETWLKATGLPDNITVEHFNDISGLDRYKDVRLLILIGRTIPGPEAVEAIAAALTGAEPVRAPKSTNGTNWYERVVRGIRLSDGTGVAVESDQHPDETAEAIRWQICEGELMQALGRGRGVNRTAATPLDIDILADVCLPITVDEVVGWRAPSEAIDMLVEGAIMTSPVDMVRVWPGIWANTRAADRTLEALKGLCRDVPETRLDVLKGLCRDVRRTSRQRSCKNNIKDFVATFASVRYQVTGSKMNMRLAYFDLAIVPDPKDWLESRLGPLAHFSIDPNPQQ